MEPWMGVVPVFIIIYPLSGREDCHGGHIPLEFGSREEGRAKERGEIKGGVSRWSKVKKFPN
jgi:hypothetical protein